MKILVNILILFFFLFFINIMLYSTNLDYKNFISSLKGNINPTTLLVDKNIISNNNVIDNVKTVDIATKNNSTIDVSIFNTGVTDTNVVLVKDTGSLVIESTGSLNIDKELEDIEKLEKENEFSEKLVDTDLEEELTKLSILDKDILSIFKDFNMVESDYYSSLFDITNEYPEKFIEYTSSRLDIIFFLDQDYRKIADFFDVVSFDLPFSINKINNFGSRSFYINLDNSDSYVRLVFEKNNRTYGLKILKSDYNNISNLVKK